MPGVLQVGEVRQAGVAWSDGEGSDRDNRRMADGPWPYGSWKEEDACGWNLKHIIVIL